MSYKPSHKFPKARKRQVGDLFIDGYDIYRWKGTRGNVRIMTNLKTGTDTELEHNRVEFMTHVAEGEVINTGAEPFHIVGVSQAPGFAITYTIDDRTVEVSAPAVQFCADLAERRAAAYGKPGERRPEGDPNVTRVRAIMRETQLPSVMINRDPDRTRGAHAVVHHNADLDITKLPDSLIVVAYGGRWVAVNLKEEPAVEPDEDPIEWASDVIAEMDEADPLVEDLDAAGNQQAVNDDPDAESDAILGAIADELRDMTADEFTDALDAVADALLDEVGEPDLAADAALPDELDEILDRPSSFGDFVRGRILSEDDLSDDDLPPADEEELPPGEPQPLPEDVAPTYRKGDKLLAKDGTQYEVTAVDKKYVHLKYLVNGGEFDLFASHADIPKLFSGRSRFVPPSAIGAVNAHREIWGDIDVTIETELIQARQRIAQLEDELARLHDESRDTEPLAPETVAEAVRASQDLARVEVVRWDDVKVESMTLPPFDIMNNRTTRRDEEIAHLRNEGWFVVYESTNVVSQPDELARVYHVARLERAVEDDDPRGDGEPEHRDIIDQAIDVVDAYEPAEQPENADAEDIVTEGDLAPIERIDAGRFPITEAIRQRGLSAVMDEMNAEAMAAFRVGAHHDAPMIITGRQS